MQVLPNPNDGDFVVKFNMDKIGDVKFSMYSVDGKKIEESILKNLGIGEIIYKPNNSFLSKGTYFVTIESLNEKATQKVIIN